MTITIHEKYIHYDHVSTFMHAELIAMMENYVQ